jgi:hypothetical protein
MACNPAKHICTTDRTTAPIAICGLLVIATDLKMSAALTDVCLDMRIPRISAANVAEWPIATEIHVPWHVGDQLKSGLVVLNVSFVARDP